MSFLQSRNKARFLLVVVVTFIFSSVTWNEMATFWISIVFPIFFAFAGAVLANNRKWFLVYLSLSAAAYLFGHLGLGSFGAVAQVMCALGAFFILFREIIFYCFFRPEVPQGDRVVAGITGYIVLGLFWFFVTRVLVELDPGSFLNQVTAGTPAVGEQLYFSFVTMTTVGYGDIVPTTAAARVAMIFTSLTGVLYLAVFVAALVGASGAEPRARGK